VNRQQEIAKAVAVLDDPRLAGPAHAGARAVLDAYHVDEHVALAEARSAAGSSGLDGRLRKDVASAGAAGAGRIVLTGPCDAGGKVRMEMDAAEGVEVLRAVRKALREVGIYE